MKQHVRLNFFAGLAIFLALAGAAWADHQHPVSCGDTVTDDTTLTAADPVVSTGPADVCPNHGLIVGADGRTLDLGGKTLRGSESRNGIGVAIGKGVNGVTIKNGTVRGFSRGVDLIDLDNNSSNNLIAEITAENNTRWGIRLSGDNNTLQDNTSRFNGPPKPQRVKRRGGLGYRVDGNNNLIEGNIGSDNRFTGMRVTGNNNTIKDNTFERNFRRRGLSLKGEGNTIEDNDFIENRDGLLLQRGGNFLAGNRAIRNRRWGFALRGKPNIDGGGNIGIDNGGKNCVTCP